MESDVVFAGISSFDDQGVSVAYLKGWPWKLTIHRHNDMVIAQPLHRRWSNLLSYCHKNTRIDYEQHSMSCMKVKYVLMKLARVDEHTTKL